MIASYRNLLSRHLLFGLSLAAALVLHAQDIMLPSDDYKPRIRKHKIPDLLPPVPTLPPAFSIPLAPLGYGPPGPTYLGRHDTLFSLDFIDENRLLVSFRAAALMHRVSGDNPANELRQMRAIVLSLPDGKVQTQTLWTVPGLDRYVWILKNGAYLLRDHDGLVLGDDKLETKPLFHLSGQLLSLEIDPTSKFLVVRTLEADPQTPPSSSGASSSAASQGWNFVRVIDLDSGEVIQTQRSREAVALPVNSEGFLSTTHDKLDQWSLNLTPFNGSSKITGHVESTCLPTTSFIADAEVLVAGCTIAHNRKLTAIAMTTPSKLLWEFETPDLVIPPVLTRSADGSRFARETIVLKNAKPAPGTLWVKGVRGQVVRIYDSANGKAVLETQASPPLDAGGNVAISPSGRRIAVLHAGTIQVFELPVH
jgi:hypothetical protein